MALRFLLPPDGLLLGSQSATMGVEMLLHKSANVVMID
jgi:hypothetical protein